MELYVVIRPHRNGFMISGWEVAGVFNDRDLAQRESQNPYHLICPVQLNQPLGPGEIFQRHTEFVSSLSASTPLQL